MKKCYFHDFKWLTMSLQYMDGRFETTYLKYIQTTYMLYYLERRTLDAYRDLLDMFASG